MAQNLNEGVPFLSAPKYQTHTRFYVFDPLAHKWQNLNSHENADFFNGCDYGEDIDEPVATLTAQLSLVIKVPNPDGPDGPTLYRSLSPYIVSTLKVRRAVELYTALTLPGVEPQTSDFRRRFSGIIDVSEVDDDTNEITLQCSDRAAYFRDMFIEEPDDRARVYGSKDGTLRERVMQQLVDRNRLGRYILWTPVSSESYVTPYIQKRTNVWEALQEHALQVGWDLRFRYFHNLGPPAGDFALTFADPGRGKTQPDYALGLGQYESLSRLTTQLTDVRNVISLTYRDAVARETRTIGQMNTASIAEYGYRFMGLQEDAASLIDTEPEALRLMEAILSDVAFPKATTGVKRRYWPYVELGQLVSLEPDYRVFSSTVLGAVTGYRHQLYGEDTTEVRLRV